MNFDSIVHSTPLIFSLHAFSCFFMTGLIWLVQLVHYPAYRYMHVETFKSYQTFHTTTITFIVGPVMVLEIFTGLALLLQQKFNPLSSLNFLGLILIWIATAVWSVPKHGQLAIDGYNPLVIESLISTNWVRTLLWTLRSIFILYFMIETLKMNPQT
jgi:hypothetical protein